MIAGRGRSLFDFCTLSNFRLMKEIAIYSTPQSQHHWLNQLVGEWDFVHLCKMPDGTENTTPGTMMCRTLGGMWLICESTYELDDSSWYSVITLGFDPEQNQYVGTFIGSMMANIWHYQGNLDGSGRRLPLMSEGPSLTGNGTTKYRDTIEIIDGDTWLFTSEMLTEDGQWVQFLDGKHLRSKRH